PFHCWHIEQMAAIFPDAVFIAIARHPAATALSALRWHRLWDESLDRWVRVNTEILRLGAVLGPQRFVLCRYEDVVLHTEPTMRALMAFLDEPWSDSLLRHDEVQRAKGAPRVSDGGTRPGEPIDSTRVGRWTAELTADQQEAVLAIAGPLCRVLGYSPDQASAAPFAAGAWTLDGAGVKQLIDQAAGAVTFVPQPRYPVSPSSEDLSAQLFKAERALARMRKRRSVRLADALKQLRQGRLRTAISTRFRSP
ncbi:MAG: sulfotransferase family protein, partial [Pseudonocardiaceae bacterium]